MNDNLISRDAVLDACSQSINILDAMSRIEDLPSATPKQKLCDVYDKYGNYKYSSDVELTEPNTATSMPCEDAISRESLKSKLKEHRDFFVNAYGGFSNLPLNDKSRVDEIGGCIAMVIDEPPITPKQRWIPVSERLPEKDGQYLVTTTNGDIARYVFNKNGNSLEYWRRCAIAWMPLPEPYKVEPQESEEGES